MKIKGFLLLVCLLLPLAADSTTILNSHQQNFLQAQKAYEKGDLARYDSLKRSLRTYVLYPYLEFEEARKNISDGERVKAFIERYPDSVLASRLQTIYLSYLGRTAAWREFHAIYKPSTSTAMQCLHLRSVAVVEGRNDAWFDSVKALWLDGATQPKECSPLFDDYYASGKVDAQMTLQRIRLAMTKNNLTLAKFLAGKLGEAEQAAYRLMLEMHKEPQATLRSAQGMRDTDSLRQALVLGMQRYARADTVAAWTFWRDSLRDKFAFSPQQRGEIESDLALRAGWRHLPQASEIFRTVADEGLNDEARQWRVRSHIRALDWKAVVADIERLPLAEREDEQWRYWRARALSETGSEAAAEALYAQLAESTSYYGFLAAEIIKRPYRFNSEPLVAPDDEPNVDKLLRHLGFVRAKELRELGLEPDAVREWTHEISKLPASERRLAARLAHRWDWHFAAILTASRASHLKDLEVRFPLAYREEIRRGARAQGLPESWVYGVMRRESAFRHDVVSSAGATGLMQLMPATAKEVARKLGITASKRDLVMPEKNISLGSAYLRQVQDQYKGHEVLATASYNAGPHRVKSWLPQADALPADVWVDTITFDETRDYVKAVMFYSTIFDWKLTDGKHRKLGERMPVVQPLARMSSLTSGG